MHADGLPLGHLRIFKSIPILAHQLIERVVDEGIGDLEIIGDEMYAVEHPLEVLGRPELRNLIRRASRQKKSTQITANLCENSYVETFDTPIQLKTFAVLHRFVEDLESLLLSPGYRCAPGNK